MDTNIRALRCAYCGDPATCRDHVIPVCVLGYRRKRFKRGDWTVPACHECNQTLGAELRLTVPERADFVLEQYRRKWRKLLRVPQWTTAEREGLDGNFRRRIEAIESLRDECERRLAHLELVALMPEDYLKP